MRNPIAILCSDLHLSLQQPACRADKDWMTIQHDYLIQLKELAGGLPIVCAGDIFDRWNTPAELINFALDNLPNDMICIPGQHDLPEHRHDQVDRSGYGVLVKAGKIIDLQRQDGNRYQSDFVIIGFGWGENIRSVHPDDLNDEDDNRVILAVLHRYVWLNEETRYPGAPEECGLGPLKKALKTYDAVVIGDNHKGWLRKKGGDMPNTEVFNCGTFIRRKSDEIDYRPAVGILHSDGTIERHFLDTSIDRFHEDAKKREEVAVNMKDFIEGLEGLGEHGFNFREAVEQHLRKDEFDKETKEIILQALEGDNKA